MSVKRTAAKQYVIRYMDERVKRYDYWVGNISLLSYSSRKSDAKRMGRYEARQAKRQLDAVTKPWGRKHELEAI